MAAFYLDNDVPLALARELRGLGHRVASTRGRGLQRAGDEAQLLTAADRAEVLVTCNRNDFFLLHDAWLRWSRAWPVTAPPRHAGIVIIPQDWLPDVAARELDALVSGPSALTDRCYRYRLDRGWELRT